MDATDVKSVADTPGTLNETSAEPLMSTRATTRLDVDEIVPPEGTSLQATITKAPLKLSESAESSADEPVTVQEPGDTEFGRETFDRILPGLRTSYVTTDTGAAAALRAPAPPTRRTATP